MGCPICDRVVQSVSYEDDHCFVAKDGDKTIVALKRHAKIPTEEERKVMFEVAMRTKPSMKWNIGQKAPDHLYLVGESG